MAGRHQERGRTGETYRLAEFLNKNWDTMVGRTNNDVALELGYKSPNMISMWRLGLAKVPLERLPDVARLMKVDLAILLPLWFEQYLGDRDDSKTLMETVFKRIASERQVAVLNMLRGVAELPLKGQLDPLYGNDELLAMEAVLKDEKLRADVLKKAKAGGVIGDKPLAPKGKALA